MSRPRESPKLTHTRHSLSALVPRDGPMTMPGVPNVMFRAGLSNCATTLSPHEKPPASGPCVQVLTGGGGGGGGAGGGALGAQYLYPRHRFARFTAHYTLLLSPCTGQHPHTPDFKAVGACGDQSLDCTQYAWSRMICASEGCQERSVKTRHTPRKRKAPSSRRRSVLKSTTPPCISKTPLGIRQWSIRA